jgi:hypothetical protein
MNIRATKPTLGSSTRRLMALPALVVAISLAFTGAASAQTAFQATGNDSPRNEKTCVQTIPAIYVTANVVCSKTDIAGYGPAFWTDNILTVVPGDTPACVAYTSVTTFQLPGGDTLVLDEGLPGTACSPGNSWNNPRNDPFGTPWPAGGINANWTVDTTGVYGANTGVFAGGTGAGTMTGQYAGPEVKATYTGTLAPATP